MAIGCWPGVQLHAVEVNLCNPNRLLHPVSDVQVTFEYDPLARQYLSNFLGYTLICNGHSQIIGNSSRVPLNATLPI